MSKLNGTVNTDKLIDMFANANDDYEQIDTMVKFFNKLYPAIQLDLSVSYDEDKLKDYMTVEFDGKKMNDML